MERIEVRSTGVFKAIIEEDEGVGSDVCERFRQALQGMFDASRKSERRNLFVYPRCAPSTLPWEFLLATADGSTYQYFFAHLSSEEFERESVQREGAQFVEISPDMTVEEMREIISRRL